MRASRLVSLLLLLQARGRLTAAQLAEQLEVSERTIYRDLADLGAAGVPVYGERGEGGGYQLLDGYRTNLTGLTPDEAGALLLTGAAAPAAQLGLGSLLAATRLKLLAAVPADLREVATRAEARFLLDPSAWVHARPPDQRHLQSVANAVWRDRQLRLSHERRGQVAQRTVHPLGLVHKTGAWYLVAAHRARVLAFRVDRIRAASVLDAPAERPLGFDLQAFWSRFEREYAAALSTFVATVRLGPRAQRYRDALGAAAPRGVVEDAPDGEGWVRQQLTFDDLQVATSALLALAPQVEVLDPPELRDELVATVCAVLALHSP
jgi:predicted DNA-binding transcriptional regulator YafY